MRRSLDDAALPQLPDVLFGLAEFGENAVGVCAELGAAPADRAGGAESFGTMPGILTETSPGSAAGMIISRAR
ncbi:hypothetical protein [Bradyrhizobium sp. 195]|nr:hypothetical protein [Bradyrhizobium sp. 195]